MVVSRQSEGCGSAWLSHVRARGVCKLALRKFLDIPHRPCGLLLGVLLGLLGLYELPVFYLLLFIQD